MFEIQVLSGLRVREAVSLILRLFPNPPLLEHPALSLPLSLAPKGAISLLGLAFLRYWVAIQDNKVVGITGLYSWKGEPKTAWLGWTCVAAAYRHQQIGRTLLEAVMLHAQTDGYEQLKLWTTDQTDYAIANLLFESLRFNVVKSEPHHSGSNRLERMLLLPRRLSTD